MDNTKFTFNPITGKMDKIQDIFGADLDMGVHSVKAQSFYSEQGTYNFNESGSGNYGNLSLFENRFSFLNSGGNNARVAMGYLELYNEVNEALGEMRLEDTSYIFTEGGMMSDLKFNYARMYDSVNADFGYIYLNDYTYNFQGVGNVYSDIRIKKLFLEDTFNPSSFGSISYEDEAYVFGNGNGTIFAGNGYFNFGLIVNTLAGTFLLVDYNSNSLGIGVFSPQARVHQNISGSNAHYHKFTNGATGITSADGFDIGIGTTGVAEIRQRENQTLDFYVNNAIAGRFEVGNNAGKFSARQGGGANQLRGVITTITNTVATVGNTTTTETDLFTFSSPASTLWANGDCIDIEYAGSFAANANNKRIRFYFAGAVLFDTTSLAFNSGNWRLSIKFFRVSTTSAKAIITWTSSNTTLSMSQTYVTWSGNLLTTNIIKLTGQATSTNDIVGEVSCIDWIPVS